jgi:F0F1-type ATP synthase membrane subunit c/vacuolar-type H+-ATPase subunit K
MLERLAIFASLVAGYPEGLAISLALKGLARYPELKATTSGAAERFIIGSFVSVLVAAGAAGLAMWLITLF